MAEPTAMTGRTGMTGRPRRPRSRRPRTRSAGSLAALLLVAGVVASVCAACGSTEPRNLVESIREGSVVLGTKYDQPGLGIRNPDKSVTGFDPTVSTFVVNHIADQLGVAHPKITWRETPSARRETMIQNGEVDMIAATYSINKSRSEDAAFAGPYIQTYQGLMVRKDDTSIQKLTDLNTGKKLCSVTGSTPASNVKAQLPDVQLQEYDTYSACVEALRRGKVDGLTTDELILAGYNDFWDDEFKLVEMTYPKDACVKDAFKAKGTPFSTERYGIGMALDYPESVKAANEALKAMLAAPPGGGDSPWTKALRENLGNEYVDEIIARSERPDSKFPYLPDVGNLSFLDSKSTPCPPGLTK